MVFLARYGRVFGVDPAAAAARPMTDLTLMRACYLAAAADADREV